MNWRSPLRVGLLVFGLLLPGMAETPASGTGASEVKPQSQSEAPSVREQAQLARQFVGQCLDTWQRRLDLEDWKISVLMTRRSAMKAKTLGGIRWNKGKKSAVIWVLDPADYDLPQQEMLEDMERTIVHELLHLELSPERRNQASRSGEERSVNRIAEAFLKLDREK